MDEHEYEAVLEAMEGDGSEESPYVVTDVQELQAIAGDLEGHYELGANVDATETEDWNETESIERERLGLVRSETFESTYTPIVEGSETLVYEGEDDIEPLDTDRYHIDYETGDIEVVDPPDDDFAPVLVSYELTEPIKQGFAPIGENNDTFQGVLDGNGFTITGLTISRAAAHAVGLLGFTSSDALIRDLGLSEVDVTGQSNVGALAGNLFRARAENVHCDGSVSGERSVGGLVGVCAGDVLWCSATASVTGGSGVGGAVGVVSSSDTSEGHDASVTNVRADGTVEGRRGVGGLIGRSDSDIVESYATGNVTGEREVGGLVGRIGVSQERASEAKLIASYATGTVTGDTDLGGLVGHVRINMQEGGRVEVEHSAATGEVRGDSNIGGLVGNHITNSVDDSVTSVRSSFATGALSGDDNVGGLVGVLGEFVNDSGEAVLRDAYWDTESAGIAAATGEEAIGDGTTVLDGLEGLQTEDMTGSKAESTMESLDFDERFETVDGEYPVLAIPEIEPELNGEVPEEEHEDASDDESDYDETAEPTEGEGSGVGVVGSLAALGGVCYVIYRRSRPDRYE